MNNSNITSSSSSSSSAEIYWRTVIPILLGLCGISLMTNGYILTSIPWLKRPLTPILCITLSLCAADFWMSLSVALSLGIITYFPVVFPYYGDVHHCVALVLVILRMSATISSVLHLLALTFNHYLGITRPLHYAVTMTPERTYFLIGVLWSVPVVGFLGYFLIVPGQAFRSSGCSNIAFYNTFSFRLSIGIIILTPLAVMCILYSHIFSVLRRRRRCGSIRANTHRLSRHRATVKTASTTALYISTFLVGWMPGILVFSLVCKYGCPMVSWNLWGETILTTFVIKTLVNALTIIKCTCNAFIYGARVVEIQRAIDAMHNAFWCKKSNTIYEDEEELFEMTHSLLRRISTTVAVPAELLLKARRRSRSRSVSRTRSGSSHSDGNKEVSDPNLLNPNSCFD